MYTYVQYMYNYVQCMYSYLQCIYKSVQYMYNSVHRIDIVNCYNLIFLTGKASCGSSLGMEHQLRPQLAVRDIVGR